MFSIFLVFVLLIAIVGFLVWLGLRARKGRVSVTTPLGANYEWFNRDQRKATEVIANQAAGRKSEEQSSSEPD